MSDFDVEKQSAGPSTANSKGRTRRTGTLFFFALGCFSCLIFVKIYIMWHAHDQLFLHHHELSRYISDRGSKVTENHSGQFPEQGAFYQDLVQQKTSVNTICEIGFNAGHSALTWLDSSPTVIVYSFDLMEHQYSSTALKFLKDRYPDRLSIVKGDSKKTVNEFIAMHHTMCDLVHVDGGKQEVTGDIMNLRSAAHCDTTLIVNNVRCDPNVGKEWDKLVEKGYVIQTSEHAASTITSCDSNDAGCMAQCSTWVIGKYAFKC